MAAACILLLMYSTNSDGSGFHVLQTVRLLLNQWAGGIACICRFFYIYGQYPSYPPGTSNVGYIQAAGPLSHSSSRPCNHDPHIWLHVTFHCIARLGILNSLASLHIAALV
jgi:hypothetical protein